MAHLEVVIETTPYACRASINRLRIIASAISGNGRSASTLLQALSRRSSPVTWNSSKQSTLDSLARSLATNTIQSCASPFSILILCPLLCTSIIKAWKCTLRFECSYLLGMLA